MGEDLLPRGGAGGMSYAHLGKKTPKRDNHQVGLNICEFFLFNRRIWLMVSYAQTPENARISILVRQRW